MAFSPEVLATLDRLINYYDGKRPYNASTNPGGFQFGGHRVNFEPALEDVATAVKAAALLFDNIDEAVDKKISDLADTLSSLIGEKASNDFVQELAELVGKKASSEFVQELAILVGDKASKTSVQDLSVIVDGKASDAFVQQLARLVGEKASATFVEDLANLVGEKADAVFVQQLADLVAEKASDTFVQQLAGIVAGKVDGSAYSAFAASVAADKQLTTVGGPSSRPGETPLAFTASIAGGAPALLPVWPSSGIGSTVDGPAAIIDGTGQIARRALFGVEVGRLYLVRWVVRRLTDVADQSNDTVRIKYAQFDQGRLPLGEPNATKGVQDLNELTTASGLTVVSRLVSLSVQTQVQADLLPAATRFIRPAVETFGVTGRTSVVLLDVVDVTDRQINAPDVADVVARLDAIDSGDYGSRLNAVESAVGTPGSLTFPTLGAAQAATIPAPVQTISLLGYAAPGDRGAGDYVRTAGAGDFTTVDGAHWARAVAIPNLRQAGGKGDGTEATTAYAALLSSEPEVYAPPGEYLIDVGAAPNLRGKPTRGPGKLLRRYLNGQGGTALDQLNSYADGMGYVLGREYMYRYMNRLISKAPQNVFVSGDSTTEGANVDPGYRIHELIQAEASRRGMFGIKAFNKGHSGKTLQEWLSTHLAQDMTDPAGRPDTYFLRWGINDIYVDIFNGFTVEQSLDRYATALDTGLKRIRQGFGSSGNTVYWPAYDVAAMTIVLCTPNSALDYTGRDNRFYEALRGIIVAAARRWQCAVIDIYALARDSRSQTFMLDTTGDEGHIHPGNFLALQIASLYYDCLFPPGLNKLSGTQLWNIGGTEPAFPAPASNDPPSFYAPMISHLRTKSGGGFPFDGALFTERQADNVVLQWLVGYVGQRPQVAYRHARLDGPNGNLATDWTDWVQLGGNGIFAGCTTNQVPAGAQRYLGPNGAQQFEAQSIWMAGGDGAITKMVVRVPDADPAGTYTYILRKNSVPTGLQIVLTGTTRSGVVTGNVPYAAGDYFGISLVTSANAAPGNSLYTLLG